MPRTMCKKAISSGSEVIYRVWKLVSIFLQRKWSELYHHAWNIPMFSVNSSHLFLSSENNCNVFLRKDIKDAKRGDSAIESKSWWKNSGSNTEFIVIQFGSVLTPSVWKTSNSLQMRSQAWSLGFQNNSSPLPLLGSSTTERTRSLSAIDCDELRYLAVHLSCRNKRFLGLCRMKGKYIKTMGSENLDWMHTQRRQCQYQWLSVCSLDKDDMIHKSALDSGQLWPYRVKVHDKGTHTWRPAIRFQKSHNVTHMTICSEGALTPVSPSYLLIRKSEVLVEQEVGKTLLQKDPNQV